MDHSPTVSDYTRKFLDQFGFQSVTFAVRHDPSQNRYIISLTTTDPSLVIGYHGESLAAMQFILAQHLRPFVGEWVNLTLNVNDYNERRERVLYDLADDTVNRVLSSHRPYALPPLTAAERRLVHIYLANHPQVSTASDGEGRSRTLVISPKV